jgi:hypothetical protein
LDITELLNKVPKDILSCKRTSKLSELKPTIDLYKKHKCLNTHIGWAYDFQTSNDFIANQNVEYYRDKLKGIKDEEYYLKWKELTEEHLLNLCEFEKNNTFISNGISLKQKVIDSIPIHIEGWSVGMSGGRDDGNYLTRFSMFKIQEDTNHKAWGDLVKTEKIIRNYINTKVITDDQYKNSFQSHLAALWAIAEASVGKYGMYIIDTLLEYDQMVWEGNLPNDYYEFDSSKSHPRKRMSILLIKAMILKQMGKINECKDVYREIMSFHKSINNGKTINYYGGNTRLTEAALCLYKLEPTEENKQKVLEYYVEVSNPQYIDSYEYPRERGLLTYQIAKTFGYV